MNSFNFSKTCRCCLDTGSDETKLFDMSRTHLFEERKTHVENVLLAESYFDLMGIDRTVDYEVLKICKNCKALLQSSYSFRELCRKSNSLISQITIKEGKAEWQTAGELHTSMVIIIFCMFLPRTHRNRLRDRRGGRQHILRGDQNTRPEAQR
jgi:Zinc-finger associated domain (zf-AD)